MLRLGRVYRRCCRMTTPLAKRKILPAIGSSLRFNTDGKNDDLPELRRQATLGWMKEGEDDLFEDALKKSLVHDLVDDNRGSANQVVPWFLTNMPRDYFSQLSKKIWYGHLRALNALFEMKETPDLALTSPCNNWVTFIKSHNYVGLMEEMLKELPTDQTPTLVRMFTSKDCILAINVFGYGKQTLAQDDEFESRWWKKRQLNSGSWSITLDQMLNTAYEAYLEISKAIAELFECRFDPVNTMPEEKQREAVSTIRERIANVVDEKMRAQLGKMLDVVADAKKTNL
eukprot:jgi/Bigna1/137461/aug1.39_g12169